jgi:indoleamine 2,3-dioxygenase
LDPSKSIKLGNICRLNNFFGGQDEEWFSMVHVAIEAIAGRALAACARAHVGVQEDDTEQIASSLVELEATLTEQVAILDRMEERSDPYVYNLRVRVPMSGWTDDRIDPEGMTYEGVTCDRGDGSWRRERYFGETGAQSTVIPAIDAALGLSCDASASTGSTDAARAQALVPYLLAMREYMPPKHAELITVFEAEGPQLREYAASHGLAELFDRCVAVLAEFRGMHLGLAQRFVRQWDKRDDDEVIGTGGTAFMPYLRAHRDATNRHAIGEPRNQDETNVSSLA